MKLFTPLVRVRTSSKCVLVSRPITFPSLNLGTQVARSIHSKKPTMMTKAKT